jgi:hypothetical protein
MADSAAQTKLDEITLGEIHGDAIRHCIEKLNNANQHSLDSVLRANMKVVTASVDKPYKIELTNAISELIEEIWKLDMMEYQKALLLDVGCDLILKPITDTQKLNAFDAVPVEDSEKHLKKLIKHAKTPMERKMHEKKLNALYKKRKRKI